MPCVPVPIAPAISLDIDIALIGDGQSGLEEGRADLVDPCAAEDGRGLLVGINLDHAGQIAEVKEQAVGRADRRKRVPGAGNPHRLPGSRRTRDQS